jgi:hypothetical protein
LVIDKSKKVKNLDLWNVLILDHRFGRGLLGVGGTSFVSARRQAKHGYRDDEGEDFDYFHGVGH